MENIIQVLKSLNLNDKEAKLYIELLKIGSQPASVLARKMDLPRSSAQFIAETLVKKSLATKHTAKKITYYQAEKPTHLPRILEAQKAQYISELEEKQQKIAKALPAIMDIQQHEVRRPQVSFFEGEAGLKMVYEDALFCKDKEGIRSLVNFEDRSNHLPKYFDDYYKRRKENKIKMHAIYPNTKFGQERHANDKEDYRESRLVDTKKYKWIPEIQFYDDKVSIASGSEKIGVIIESKEISEAMKVLFDLAWKSGECEE